jgi:SAM-dependent methyltransferase
MNQRQVSDVWERGDPYERYVGRWSRQVAPLFLNWLNVPPDRRWLDIGCGTGALCAAILDACEPLSVAGVEPSEGFLESARRQLGSHVTFYLGSATAIPLENDSVDVVVSGLVLNFVPDQHAALAEMVRVAGQGGIIGAYVWDYAEKMELMRYFWDAAIQLDPNLAALDEGLRFPLCRPEALTELFAAEKLEHIEVKAIDILTVFASFEDYWSPFLGGQGPAPAYAMSLEEPARLRLRESLKERIPMLPDGSISMTARAWAIQARVAD